MGMNENLIRQKITEFVQDCKDGKLPIISQLAIKLGVPGKRGLEKLKKDYPGVAHDIDMALTRIERHYESYMAEVIQGGTSVNAKALPAAIFMMKNFGWTDGQQEETVEILSSVNEALQRIEQRRAQQIQLKKGDKEIVVEVKEDDGTE